MKYKRLSLEERETISRLLAWGKGIRQIAEELKRAPGTISREVRRNFLPSDAAGYRASSSQQRAEKMARTSHRKTPLLTRHPEAWNHIHANLRKYWSPAQCAQCLNMDSAVPVTISHETIYSFIYMLPRGELKKELISYLRHRKPRRQNRKAQYEKRGVIPDMISIKERPEEVAGRSMPGHWEGDLIIGKDHKSAIGTIVERQTRFVILVKLKAKDAESVRKAFAAKMIKLPDYVRRSLTYDQGKEMAQHARFSIDTNMKVFFCDPASPWQRGTCENTNGLIRNFFPKGTDFGAVSAQKLSHVQKLLNERPRKTLNWKTPQFALNQIIETHKPPIVALAT